MAIGCSGVTRVNGLTMDTPRRIRFTASIAAKENTGGNMANRYAEPIT
jgi:hypothetical protein